MANRKTNPNGFNYLQASTYLREHLYARKKLVIPK